MTEHDPRKSQRFPLIQRATVKLVSEFPAVTRNISGGGIFLDTSDDVLLHSSAELMVCWPAEMTDSVTVPMICRGSVVRVRKLADRLGLAIAFHGYEMAQDLKVEAPTPDIVRELLVENSRNNGEKRRWAFWR